MNPYANSEHVSYRHKNHSKYETTDQFLQRMREHLEERRMINIDNEFRVLNDGTSITYDEESNIRFISDMLINNVLENNSRHRPDYMGLVQDKKRLYAIVQAQHIAMLKMIDQVNAMSTQLVYLKTEIESAKCDIHNHYHEFLDHRDIDHEGLPYPDNKME